MGTACTVFAPKQNDIEVNDLVEDCPHLYQPVNSTRFWDDLQELFPLQQIVSPLHLDTLYDCRSGHVNIQTKHLRKYIKFGKFANSKKWIIRFKCGVKGSDKVDEDASCCVPDMALRMFHKSPFYVSIQFLIPCKMTEKH